jgi:hypothetical protein
MNRSVPSVLSLALLAGLCPSPGAHAQEFNTPKFHMWGAYPAGHTPSTAMVQRFIQPHLYYFYQGNPNRPLIELAEIIAEDILAEIAADDGARRSDSRLCMFGPYGNRNVKFAQKTTN